MLTFVGRAMNKLKKIGHGNESKVVLLCDECQHNDHCGILTSLTNAVMAVLECDNCSVLVINSIWLFDSISCGENGSSEFIHTSQCLLPMSSENSATSRNRLFHAAFPLIH